MADPNPYWTRAAEEVERGTHWLDNAAEMYEEGMRSAGHYGDAGLRDAEDFRAKYFKLQDATRRGAPHGELADLYWEFDAEREKLDKHVRRFREMAPYANPAEEIRGVKSELERIIDHANKEEHLIRGTPEAGPHLEPGGSRPDLSRMDRDALLEEISQRRDRALALSDEVAGAGSIIENPASSAHARRVAASDARAMMDRAFRGASKVVKRGTKGVLGGVAGLGAEILMPTDLGAADIEDPRYMSPDDPRRIRAERDVAGAEFLAEQPGFGATAPWAGQEPRPRDPSAYENQETGMETQDFNLPRDIADQLAPPVTEYPEEEQLMAAAEDLDATKEEAFASMAPIGDFSKDALNSLVDALNKALPLFGAPEDYATFAEDIEGALPTEFVRYLAMTSQAANDANLGRLAVDLENIGTDSDLMKAAGQLDVLAENDSFRTFMASADQETEAPVEEVVEEEVQVQTPISDTEVEAMFVERAR